MMLRKYQYYTQKLILCDICKLFNAPDINIQSTPPPPKKNPPTTPLKKTKQKTTPRKTKINQKNAPANFSYAGVKFSKPPVTVQILYMNPSCCEINFTNVQSLLRAKSLSGPQIFSFYLELLFCLYLIWANGYFVLAVTSHVPR